MSQAISKNLEKALGLTHFLETIFLQNPSLEKKATLQNFFQPADKSRLVFDLASIIVAPMYYQIKASEHFLNFFVEAFSGFVHMFNQQGEEKNKAFSESLKCLGQFALCEGQTIVSPFLNTLGFVCQSLLASYQLIKKLPELAASALNCYSQSVQSNWESISASLHPK